MKGLVLKLEEGETKSFSIGELVINYPGYKKTGDYQLTINGIAPKHTEIVNEIYKATTSKNIDAIISFLDDVYTNGLNAKPIVFSKECIEKRFWITLQEEINYPQPKYRGRKLPFQRFYEAALAKMKNIDVKKIETRTNNHGSGVPKLFKVINYAIPSFYN